MSDESYIDGLKYELAGAQRSGDKDHEKAVKAELARVSGGVKETATKADDTEKA
jgi:hypothetical protein